MNALQSSKPSFNRTEHVMLSPHNVRRSGEIDFRRGLHKRGAGVELEKEASNQNRRVIWCKFIETNRT